MSDDTPDSTRASAGTDAATAEKEWWDDPRLPWGGEPSRADVACFWLIGGLGLYGLALLPLRAVLVAHPYFAAALTGSRTGVVMIGAFAATSGDLRWLPLWWLVATLSVMKFDPIYFWAGKLWGRGLFEMVAGRSERARRGAERAERIAQRFQVPAILLTYLPVPLPASVIYATLAAAGMSWRRFLVANFCFAGLMQGLYLWLGHRIGAPAVAVVTAYGKWAWYVSIAILVGMLVTYAVQQRRRRAD